MHITTKIIVASAGVMVLVAGGSAAFAAADRPAPKVSIEQAIQTAQKQVPGSWVREVGFDGRATQPDVWEVELVEGNTEHEVDIDAATGKLLKNESERADSDDDNATAGQTTQNPQNAQDSDDSDDSDDSQDDD
jgi:hypothetical protein